MFNEEAANTNFVVFSLTCLHLGLEHMIYHTQDEHAKPYMTEADKRFRSTTLKTNTQNNTRWKQTKGLDLPHSRRTRKTIHDRSRQKV